jgi:hypothetical protein
MHRVRTEIEEMEDYPLEGVAVLEKKERGIRDKGVWNAVVVET